MVGEAERSPNIMTTLTRAIALLVSCGPLLSSCASLRFDPSKSTPIGAEGAIFVAPGDTVFFVVVGDAPGKGSPVLDKVSTATRIKRPRREKAAVKATFDQADLRIRNGYDHVLEFGFNSWCFSMQAIDPEVYVPEYATIAPGAEVNLKSRSWAPTAVMCQFKLLSNPTMAHNDKTQRVEAR